MAVDLLCLGEPMVELNQQPDGFFLPGHGGDVSNCAVAAARQGASVGCLACIGVDDFGNQFINLWNEEGIDVSSVKKLDYANTALYFVRHSEHGHEFDYYRIGSASSIMTKDDLDNEALRSCKILHVSGISQGISKSAEQSVMTAIETVKQAGGQVSYDTNLRLKLWELEKARDVIHSAMTLCDIALPAYDDAVKLTKLDDPEKIVDFYLKLGAKIVSLSLGEKGALVATLDSREYIEAITVKMVDTTGAGDTFDGAFLARLLAGYDPFDSARYANVAAALSTCGYGAVEPIPNRDQVETALLN